MKKLILFISLLQLIFAACKREKTNYICPAIVDPVCGWNQKEYGNACEAKADGVKLYTSGPCKR